MIAGLVLAAGAGTRFGQVKQLAELDGRPLLEHSIRAMTAAPVDRVVVVLGAGADQVIAKVDPHGSEFRICDRWDEGQSASLACGLAAVADCEAAVITLGDQPRMSPEAIRRVIAARAEGVDAVRATYAGEPGHPVTTALATCCSAFTRARWLARTSAAARTWTRPSNWMR